ncbi:hypothetical protein GWK47_038712 [Chionoecetes opilio]|uniref:Uncharacterized protein n=1 Tax=Chionoecetes opilio TaxID=41210 RepID=A0A8J4YDT6_CHIOP|nr:hypothetical protein GWK47_038712 [Chionoecetes opilio]
MSWTGRCPHNWMRAQFTFSACGLRAGGRSASQLVGRGLVVVVPAFGMALQLQPSTLSHRSGASWAAGTEPLLGETASQERAGATALIPLRQCAAEVGERSGFPRHAEVAVVWAKARIPTQKKRRCVERILRLCTHHGRTCRSKKRSDEEDEANLFQLTSRMPELLTGADDAFRHRATREDALTSSTVDEDRQFLLAALPGWTRCIMQGVDQSLADRERRRPGARRA